MLQCTLYRQAQEARHVSNQNPSWSLIVLTKQTTLSIQPVTVASRTSSLPAFVNLYLEMKSSRLTVQVSIAPRPAACFTHCNLRPFVSCRWRRFFHAILASYRKLSASVSTSMSPSTYTLTQWHSWL